MPNIETLPDAGARSGDSAAHTGDGKAGIGSYIGTVALVGLGVALIEEELLAGMALGVAAMAFPSAMPKLRSALRPLMKSAVRAGYTVADRTREAVAEMSEQFEDVMAELRAEKTRAHEAAAAHEGAGHSEDAHAHGTTGETPAGAGETDTAHAKKPSRASRPPAEPA